LKFSYVLHRERSQRRRERRFAECVARAVNQMNPRLVDVLWPTLSTGAGIVLNEHGTLAVLPLRQLTRAELLEACVLQRLLDRGLLVVA
jgi:hypothetical protein